MRMGMGTGLVAFAEMRLSFGHTACLCSHTHNVLAAIEKDQGCGWEYSHIWCKQRETGVWSGAYRVPGL